MLFEQEFIDEIEEQPVLGIIRACDIAVDKQQEHDDGQGWSEQEHEVLWEAATFIEMVAIKNGMNLGLDVPNPSVDMATNCQNLMEYIQEVRVSVKAHQTQFRINSFRNRYAAALKAGFAYEFSKGDLDRVQQLINELREQIGSSDSLEDDHRRRLQTRLESLQAEVHKRVTDLDRFWGLVGDAGVVLGKLGKDAKPIVDRVKEIAEIVWRTQARAEELPSGTENPMLERDKNA